MKAKVTIYGDNRSKIVAGSKINPGDISPQLIPKLVANDSIEMEPSDIQAAFAASMPSAPLSESVTSLEIGAEHAIASVLGNQTIPSQVGVTESVTSTPEKPFGTDKTGAQLESQANEQVIDLATDQGIIDFFNKSDNETLQKIKGIGPGLAEAIITQREISTFVSVAQLQQNLKSVDMSKLELVE